MRAPICLTVPTLLVPTLLLLGTLILGTLTLGILPTAHGHPPTPPALPESPALPALPAMPAMPALPTLPELPDSPESPASSRETDQHDENGGPPPGDTAENRDPAKLLPPEQTRALQSLLEYLIRENLPRSHVDEDDWGRTKRVYAGVRITRDDWKLSTKRRWKEVKHGRWQRFSVHLVDPDHLENLRVGVQVLSWEAETGQLRARLTVDCAIGLFARRMRYNYGVRLFSIHAEGTARARLTLDAAVTVGLDYQQLPPAVVVTPQVEYAQLQISEFHLKQLSQLHGDPAEWAGEVVDEWLQKKWLPQQNQQLAERLNQQIAKQQDSLRFSMSDWLQNWLQP